MQINPYLAFAGQCEAAFTFYAKCLGGKLEAMLTHEGTPAEGSVPPEWRKKILHARLRTDDGAVLMGGDAPPTRQVKPQGFCVSIQVKEPAEAERIFHALAENGTLQMPIQETFWAIRFGMLIDQFGTPWMINCPRPE
jgi:PhnB protein